MFLHRNTKKLFLIRKYDILSIKGGGKNEFSIKDKASIKNAIFEPEGYYVWCGTMTKGEDGLYYLYFSFWEKPLGFSPWVTRSKVGYAAGSDPSGKFEYRGIALDGRGQGYRDGDVIHKGGSVVC